VTARLFVYGSLKRGGRHHDELRGARFLGQAATSWGYRLEAHGEYLGLVESALPDVPEGQSTPNEPGVQGELFAVTEELLTALDEFEGDTYLRGHVRLAPGPSGEFHGIVLAYFKKAR
jgi:gamma-glutamylaminecyclotransferase